MQDGTNVPPVSAADSSQLVGSLKPVANVVALF